MRESTGNQPVLDVAVFGAGVSGICMGIKLSEAGIENFLILEKSARVGGTWQDNTYPGASCDVASVLYSYSFEPNPNWSRKYSAHDEIREYLEHCARKYGIFDRIRTNTEVKESRFDDETGLWVITLENGDVLRAHNVASGLGQLNIPNIPAFDGAERFAGERFHSARWRHDIPLAGKRVAVIGNAASALQFIPTVAAEAEQLYVYQRTPNHVIKRGDRAYTNFEKKLFKAVPLVQKWYRLLIFLRGELLMYPVMRNAKLMRKLFDKMISAYREEYIKEEDTLQKLTPDYTVGCKRILISDDYFTAFTRPTTHIVTSPITDIGKTGVITADEVDRPVDVIIYGTGFKTMEFLSSVDFYGRHGVSLNETWKEGAEAYRGVVVSGFPNLYMMYGPNTNLGSNSIIFMVEQQVNYSVRCIQKQLANGLKTLEVKQDVMDSYNDQMQAEMGNTVWVSQCESWYKNAAGKVVNNWPKSNTAYWWEMRATNFDDFDMSS